MHEPPNTHLAHVIVACAIEEMDSPRSGDFMSALDKVKQLLSAAPVLWLISGESLSWAMVNDVVSDLVIIGLDESALPAFRESFAGEYFDVQGAVEKLEADHGGQMSGADRAIANYGQPK
jgi:hypothetical protein